MNPTDKPPINYHTRTIFSQPPEVFAQLDANLVALGVKAQYLQHQDNRCYRIPVKELSKLPKSSVGYWIPVSGKLTGWTLYPVDNGWFDEYYQHGWNKHWNRVGPARISKKRNKK